MANYTIATLEGKKPGESNSEKQVASPTGVLENRFRFLGLFMKKSATKKEAKEQGHQLMPTLQSTEMTHMPDEIIENIGLWLAGDPKHSLENFAKASRKTRMATGIPRRVDKAISLGYISEMEYKPIAGYLKNRIFEIKEDTTLQQLKTAIDEKKHILVLEQVYQFYLHKLLDPKSFRVQSANTDLVNMLILESSKVNMGGKIFIPIISIRSEKNGRPFYTYKLSSDFEIPEASSEFLYYDPRESGNREIAMRGISFIPNDGGDIVAAVLSMDHRVRTDITRGKIAGLPGYAQELARDGKRFLDNVVRTPIARYQIIHEISSRNEDDRRSRDPVSIPL